MLSLSILEAKQPNKAKSPVSRTGSSANSPSLCQYESCKMPLAGNAKPGDQHEGVMEDLWQFLG